MKIKRLLWFDEIIEKLIIKHKVQQEEIREVLANKPYFRFVEKGHLAGENVYAAMGQTGGGRYLIVFLFIKKIRAPLFYQLAR